ncbi:PolC-type DNA polymerase III [Clostridium sp. D2Q-11]|uniref:DNA polymerase III PolC-type n=1 Tax=Anaeromonas frigoriresistens TaxID=2683708 RepID=A0A942Z7T9_9FIRM|nr:PolC-type DNA polymerase III [Anaeromonas frigoriresistens]MBS4539886.1 PolC-type DNA polymerase III [Anaeromonas frigoriresistens]
MIQNYKLDYLVDKHSIKCSDELRECKIEKVYLNNSNRIITLKLKSIKIINFQDIELLKASFKKILKGIDKINITIKYDLDKIDNNWVIDNYWNNIIYMIKHYIPSSTGWINNIKKVVNNNDLLIEVEDELFLQAILNKKLNEIIKMKIKEEFDIDIEVKIVLNDNEASSFNDHYQQKELVEKKMVEKIKITSEPPKSNNYEKNNIKSEYVFGKRVDDEIISMKTINTNSGTITIKGEVFDIETKEIKNNKKIYMINVTDFTNSIQIKIFANKKQQEVIDAGLTIGDTYIITGDIVYDSFSRELVMMGKGIKTSYSSSRKDKNKEKRVELHLHTQMSDMDGMTNITQYVKRAKEWGHKAIGITDHGVVQGFPEGMSAANKHGVKVLYGVEGYLVNDSKQIVINSRDQDIDCEYIVFDIETTGFSPINDGITEIGAVKIVNNQVVDTFSKLVNPQKKIPLKVVELTGITDEMVRGEPTIDEILPEFKKFIGDAVLVAHNASFDMGFISKNFNDMGITLSNPILDTLQFARELYPNLKSHRLNRVAKYLNVSLENHHRAVDDSKATADILLKMIYDVKNMNVTKLEEINTIFSGNINYKSQDTHHIIIYAQNYTGLKNLYKIVSESHINYFYRKPRIPKSLLNKYREGLIIGTACEAGELYRAILRNKSDKEVREIVNFYDYLEVQPLGNNNFLVENGMVKDVNELKNINKKIYHLGKKYNKIVVATGDAHFLDPQDEAYRRILMAGKGFSDADNQAPLYFKTTDEMLEEFSYLGEEIAEEVVIKNTNIIADMIEEILPIPNGTFPPVIEGSDKDLKDMTYNKAKNIYGDPIPEIVKSRLDKELNSIISNGYAVLYIISHKLVKKSLEDGYLVGSRGSVGSSFVATMSDITEVNPLPPHYVCPDCKNSEFITDGSVGSGVDMKDKNCPKCGTNYKKDGFDIPFEVFLGFEGDKEPDIDLNFASEEQTIAMQYTEDLFGEGHVYRAGTIGTIADKTAYGFIRKYYEERELILNRAETSRLINGCTGIKRTSGQHPGGVMVVPQDKDIYDFTPIQYPANNPEAGVITTHFDYHSISGRILKLDILGHDTPTIIRMLEDLTGEDAQKISLDDPKTMKIFTSTETLGITPDDINCKTGSFGIPEFGTRFVIQMLLDTQPTTFAELVRISGLSHGTDVWLNNAQDLVINGVTTLKEVISTRDDIMMYLIYNGLDKKKSFKIMEKVRKGKGLTEEEEEYMRDNNIPEWYIDSCKKIKYMFPKAHAVAYVMMSFRIAYFKVHHPEAFYATYFTMKATDFDAELITKGTDTIKSKINEIEELGNNKTAKEKNLLTVLEVALEMYARGYTFNKVDLYHSHNDIFLITDDGILPPLKSLQGVGENAAKSIVEARQEGKFLSIEDITKRAKVSKTVIEALRVHGCLDGMSESNQLDLFSI